MSSDPAWPVYYPPAINPTPCHHWSDGYDVGHNDGYSKGYGEGYATCSHNLQRTIERADNDLARSYVDFDRIVHQCDRALFRTEFARYWKHYNDTIAGR